MDQYCKILIILALYCNKIMVIVHTYCGVVVNDYIKDCYRVCTLNYNLMFYIITLLYNLETIYPHCPFMPMKKKNTFTDGYIPVVV